jgi:hypothetical protein
MKESMDPNANIFEEYLATVDSILGFYLDTLVAYGYSLRYLDEGQKAAIAEFKRRGEDWSVEDLDAKSLIFGEGDPNTSDAVVLHQTTEGQYKARNRKGGSNHRIIGNLCIVLLYQYWEDHFRSNFAEVLKMHKNDPPPEKSPHANASSGSQRARQFISLRTRSRPLSEVSPRFR